MESTGFKPGKIWISRDLIKSEAFRSLSAIAIIVYLDFLAKVKRQKVKRRGRKTEYLITNNGEIVYTYKEAENTGITRPRFQRAIDELLQKGFIDICHQGSGGSKGDTSKYAISERWRKYGTEEFEKRIRPKDTRDGRGFSAYWRKRREEERRKKIIKMKEIIKIRKERREKERRLREGSHEKFNLR